MIVPGQTVYFHFPVQNPETGAAIDADSLPLVYLAKNGVVDGGSSVSVTRSALGSYSCSFVVSMMCVPGDDIQVRASAIVRGIQSPPVVVFQDTVDSARFSAVQVDTAAIKASQLAEEADISTIKEDISTIKGSQSTEEADIAAIKESQLAEEEAILLIPTLGDGSKEKNYGPLLDSVSGAPIADAEITVYSDVAMTDRIAYGRTNQYGYAGPFQLDPGTVYIKRSKTGYTFANPDVEVVDE